MWLSKGFRKSLYFYVENFRCYNMTINKVIKIDPGIRKDWEADGGKRIGADCLGEWLE